MSGSAPSVCGLIAKVARVLMLLTWLMFAGMVIVMALAVPVEVAWNFVMPEFSAPALSYWQIVALLWLWGVFLSPLAVLGKGHKDDGAVSDTTTLES